MSYKKRENRTHIINKKFEKTPTMFLPSGMNTEVELSALDKAKNI